eukprot:2228019-Rhodomonas_salina.1
MDGMRACMDAMMASGEAVPTCGGPCTPSTRAGSARTRHGSAQFDRRLPGLFDHRLTWAASLQRHRSFLTTALQLWSRHAHVWSRHTHAISGHVTAHFGQTAPFGQSVPGQFHDELVMSTSLTTVWSRRTLNRSRLRAREVLG